jgi:hypothetical protein
MDAFKAVKANAGSAGVDKQAIGDFDSDPHCAHIKPSAPQLRKYSGPGRHIIFCSRLNREDRRTVFFHRFPKPPARAPWRLFLDTEFESSCR